MGSAQLDGVSRVPMSSSLCIRRESCALSAPRACYRHAGDGRVCAFAKAVASQENAAVVLGLAGAALTRPCKGIRLTRLGNTRAGPAGFYGVSLGRALAA